MAIAEDLAVIHDPLADEAFHVEQHGVDFIPASERWATPRDVFGMWAGASVQIEYFIYGCILMTFSFTFVQAAVVIVIGNLSYLLLGLCSPAGPPDAGRPSSPSTGPLRPNGGRPISFFNWITQIGFEVEGLILIVGAGLVLDDQGGLLARRPGQGHPRHRGRARPGDPAVLRVCGHRQDPPRLVIPFVVLFAVLLGFRHPARQHCTSCATAATGRPSSRHSPSPSP